MINESSSIQGMRIDPLPRVKKKINKLNVNYLSSIKEQFFVLIRLHDAKFFLSTEVAKKKVNMNAKTIISIH